MKFLAILCLYCVSALACLPGMARADACSDGQYQEWTGGSSGNSGNPPRLVLVLCYYSSLPRTVIEGLERAVPEGATERNLSWTPSAVATGGDNLQPGNLSNPADADFLAHPLVTGSYDLFFPQCWGLRGRTVPKRPRVSIAFAGGAVSQQLFNTEGNSVVTAQNPYLQASGTKGQVITLDPLKGHPNKPEQRETVSGDAGMQLDLSQVRRAGLHSGGSFTLTVELY